MSTDLSHWTPRPRPAKKIIEGRYVRLEPLNANQHAADLHLASTPSDAQERFRWLFEFPPQSLAETHQWIEQCAVNEDVLFFAVIDQQTQRTLGRQAFMRIEPGFGCLEIGHIYWGPAMAKTRLATEAQFLFMQHAFKDLRYRRYEWKCNALNTPSRAAALRFGFSFEGVFRQHMIVKNQNRDTAWYSIIDSEWPRLAKAYHAWLDPSNFDEQQRQRVRLSELIDQA